MSALACPHCGDALFRGAADGSRLKARTSMLVLHKSGDVEINCAACKRGVLLPLSPIKDAPLRKATETKFIVPLDKHAKRRA